MENLDADRRWRELTALQSEVGMPAEAGAAELPALGTRADGRPRQISARTVRFAEALAFDDSWSRIGDARRRRGWVH